MSRILLTWELGGALGHLVSLRPLAESFLNLGHQVFLAARSLAQVRHVFNDPRVTLLQAPWNNRRAQLIKPVVTYADLLLTVGFSDEDSLAAHIEAWQSLYKLVEPDLLVCDHSPTALFAARGQRFAVTTAGSGFYCPPDESPLRLMRDMPPDVRTTALKHELYLLDVLNRSLSHRGLPHLSQVSQLYHDGQTRHFLMTLNELDHFGVREDTKYWGMWPFGVAGEAFRPPGRPCVFAYLKSFPTINKILDDLRGASFYTIAYVDALSHTDRARFQSEKLRISDSLINFREAAENCDVALTNATHATCLAMLLCGKPMVHVPHFLEQFLLAGATERVGAGLIAQGEDPLFTRRAIEQVLADARYRRAALSIAERYHGHRFDLVAEAVVDEMEQLMQSRS
jgi:UDP:flavonoid glycosyltransferase YjiC (YdhE family)